MLRNIYSVLLILIFCTKANCQGLSCECFIAGKIIDQQTKEPLIGAIVNIKKQNKSTFSDVNGNYKIEKLCEGKFLLTVNILGYESKNFEVNLSHETKQNINLTEKELHLEEINITAKRIENIGNNQLSLSAEELQKKSGQNLANTLEQLAGVSMIQTGSTISKPVIQGLHSNRILTLNNGVRHEGQQWGNEHAPEIDPFLAKKITVLKGAKGVRYGSDAIGGVIIVESADLKPIDSIKTEINNSFFSNGRQIGISGIVEGGIPKLKNFGWRIQATGKKAGNVSTPTYNLANTGFTEFNFSLESCYLLKKADFKVFFSQFNTKIGIFSGSHIGNISDLKIAIERAEPLFEYTPEEFSYTIGRPLQDIQHNLIKFKSNFNLKSNQSLQLVFANQYNYRSEIDVLRGDRNIVQTFKINSTTYEIIFNHKPIFKKITGFIGSNGLSQINISTGDVKTPFKSGVLIPNFKNFTSGIFFVERWIHPKFDLEIGGRYDIRNLQVFYLKRLDNKVTNDNLRNQNFSGTISFIKKINKNLGFTFTSASAWRPATVNELYSDGVHHGTATYEKGNSSLGVEKALSNSINFTAKFKQVDSEINFYTNFINNYIFIAPTGESVLTIRGAFPEFAYSKTNAVFKGVDFTNKFQIVKNLLEFKNQVSLIWADDRVRKQPLIFIPANKLDNSIIYMPSSFIFSEIIFRHVFVAKQNRVPIQNIFENAGSNNTLLLYGGDYLPAPAAYNLFEISFNKSMVVKNIGTLKLGFEVKNLLNSQYRDYLNRFRYFSNDLGRNFAFRSQFVF